MPVLKYRGFNDARAHLKDLLDAAAEGRAAVVERHDQRAAVVDQARFVQYLRSLHAGRVALVPDDDGWLAVVIDTAMAAEGDTAAEAVDDLIDVLRDYATDWHDRLRHAPNHQGSWSFVQLVDLSDDDELRGWILGSAEG